MEKMKRMGAKMTQSRKKAEKALYDKFKSQEKPDMPNAFSPGSIFIKFGNKKIKKIPTVEEMMKMRERKKKAKKKTKKKKAHKKKWKGISKKHRRMIRKSKKKGGRRRRRTRKKRGGVNQDCNCQEGDKFTLKEEAHELYDDTEINPKTGDGKGIYKITKILHNYIYFNGGEPGGDDEKNVIISQLQEYFEPLQRRRADTPGGRRRRTKKKRRKRR
jgi:hypothetical protein